MSPADAAAAVKARLCAELRDDLRTVESLAAAVAKLDLKLPDDGVEWMRARALAFEIERWYTAVESSMQRALQTLDGQTPSGPRWHLELLRAAAVPVAGGRPAIVSPAAFDELRELLKFRHLARHGYEQEPDLALLTPQAARVARATGALRLSFADLERYLLPA